MPEIELPTIEGEDRAPWYIRTFVPVFVYIVGAIMAGKFSNRIMNFVSVRKPAYSVAFTWLLGIIYIGVIVVTIAILWKL
jgi:uncharacterized membrane protein SirB2